MSAWLVTWHWVGYGPKPKTEDEVAAILNWRLSGETVRKTVELLYANSEYSPSERLEYAKSSRNARHPAQFHTIDGIPWHGRIICGRNPCYLYARMVDDLRVEVDKNGDERLTWKERPKPTLPISIRSRLPNFRKQEES